VPGTGLVKGNCWRCKELSEVCGGSGSASIESHTKDTPLCTPSLRSLTRPLLTDELVDGARAGGRGCDSQMRPVVVCSGGAARRRGWRRACAMGRGARFLALPCATRRRWEARSTVCRTATVDGIDGEGSPSTGPVTAIVSTARSCRRSRTVRRPVRQPRPRPPQILPARPAGALPVGGAHRFPAWHIGLDRLTNHGRRCPQPGRCRPAQPQIGRLTHLCATLSHDRFV
jgi:hypothetical protein